MTTWESGRESSLLDEMLAGHKTIEGRLNRGKFAQYKPGDTIYLRRDIRDDRGILHDGELKAATAEVIAVRHYETFLEMVTEEGFKKVIPSARSAQEAADEYDKFYPTEDQAAFGVLAIEVKILK